MKVRIVSDGTTYGTCVLDENGKSLEGVTRIEISPLDGGGNPLVEAKLTFSMVKLDMIAESRNG